MNKNVFRKNICGISYEGQNINNSNFEKTKSGQKKILKYLINILGIVVTYLFCILPILSGASLAYVIHASLLLKSSYGYFILTIIIVIFLTSLVLIINKGFELLGIISIAIPSTIIIIIGGVITALFEPNQNYIIYVTGSITLFLGLSICLALPGVTLMAISISCTSISSKNFGEFLAFLGANLTATITSSIMKPEFRLITLIPALAIISTGAIIARKAIRGSPKFAWIREKAVFWTAIGGTSFYKADLTDVCFDGSDLRYTDFRNAILNRTSFENVTGLELSRLQGTILEQPKVRKLLISKDGISEDYTGANFNGASLRQADLTGANLTEVQALDADFTGATLTDACIQGWNINKNTCFKDVTCKRVYLKGVKKGNTLTLSEPKPDSGEFKPGEFEKWISELQSTIDLIFREGLNWRAFIFSIAQTAIDHEGLDLSRYSITRKDGNTTFAQIGVFSWANNEAIHQAFQDNYKYAEKIIESKYQLVLQAKDSEIERLRVWAEANQQILRELTSVVAGTERQILIQGEAHKIYLLKQSTGEIEIMDNKEETHVGGDLVGGNKGNNASIGSIGGDMTLTGASLAGNLNQVSNTIQQLRDVNANGSDELAQILTVLKESIAQDNALSEGQKKDALDAVETLAKEGKKPPEERALNYCSMAVNALKGITGAITDASKLAEVLKTYLPTLTGLLGI